MHTTVEQIRHESRSNRRVGACDKRGLAPSQTALAHPRTTIREAPAPCRNGLLAPGSPAAAIALTTLALALPVGCLPSDAQISSFIRDWEATVSASDYVVMPPDSVEVSSSNAPEVDGETQIVRQDGKISLRLIGEVKIAGLTPLEISHKLESLLRKYYVEPKVNVRVLNNSSKKYYVFGQVGAAGGMTYTGRDTVLSALAKAQPTFLAWKSQVKVIRPSHRDSMRSVMTVNVDRILTEGKLDQNVLLQEGDIIYVPPTPLAWIGLRLREVLFPFGPVLQTVGLPGDTIVTAQYAADPDNARNGRRQIR